MANVHIRFKDDDDIDNYEPSDSEDEYTENEKRLLKNARSKRKNHSDSEEEVFGLNNESISDDEKIADSDIEGQNDNDDLPDVRAWGKNKRNFYSTDYVDQDYGGFQGKDAVAAEFEEEEARAIQKRLTEQLDDEDFSLDIFSQKSDTGVVVNEDVLIKSDLSTLSKRELLQLLQKESPEFFVLVDDFKAKMKEIKDYLSPIIRQSKEGKIPECEALEFVQTLYHLILNYCSNIHMYLLLKASKTNVKNHPVLKRLFQYRKLIAQLEPIYEEIIRPQIEIMINSSKENDDTVVVKKTKKLKLLKNLDSPKKEKSNSISLDEAVNEKQPKSILKSDKTKTKHVSFNEPVKQQAEQIEKDSDSESNSDMDQTNEEETKEVEEKDESLEGSKRAITYQMKKNKGLTPKRKKELRNPRVKHRNKFRKAKIRRKGAVREVRKETTRYSGEISGIKASVSKSIKLK